MSNTEPMTQRGYLLAKDKLANMEARLVALRTRSDLDLTHRDRVEQSYLDMIRQYRREIKRHEASHPN